jgi:hypothetical protein
MLATNPSQAAKPGGGGTGDACKGLTAAQFPAYIYGYTTIQGGVTSVAIRIANADGTCVRTLATVPGVERQPLLLDLDNNEWRAVWQDGDGVSSDLDGIVVSDFSVGADASLAPIAESRVATGRTVGLESGRDGSILFLKPAAGSSLPGSLWRTTVSRGGSAGLMLTTVPISVVNGCNLYEFAIGPDGDSLYYASPRPDGFRGTRVNKASLATLPGDLTNLDPTCGMPVVEVLGGNAVQLAAGRCGVNGADTCLAMERHNVRGIPCTPDYYRTDVFALGAGGVATEAGATVQMARPAWGAAGTLLGRLTGSTSKNACTAKIYENLVRRNFDVNLVPGTAVAIGVGRTLDAPNPIDASNPID